MKQHGKVSSKKKVTFNLDMEEEKNAKRQILHPTTLREPPMAPGITWFWKVPFDAKVGRKICVEGIPIPPIPTLKHAHEIAKQKEALDLYNDAWSEKDRTMYGHDFVIYNEGRSQRVEWNDQDRHKEFLVGAEFRSQNDPFQDPVLKARRDYVEERDVIRMIERNGKEYAAQFQNNGVQSIWTQGNYIQPSFMTRVSEVTASAAAAVTGATRRSPIAPASFARRAGRKTKWPCRARGNMRPSGA